MVIRTLAPGWVLRGQYHYHDSRLDGDPVYSKRRLSGAPSHLIGIELQWRASRRIMVPPSVEWQPSRTWVDPATRWLRRGRLLNLHIAIRGMCRSPCQSPLIVLEL